MTSPMLVIVDDRVDNYQDLRAPENVTVLRRPWDMADCMRYVFDTYPDEAAYGWIADDNVPITPGFDKLMEMATEGWFVVDCEDHFWCGDKDISHTLVGCFVWGGKLVRAVGWWALPKVRQAGIDDAWCDICTYYSELRRHCADIVVEHHNWRSRKRPEDRTDSWRRDGVNYVANDFRIWNDWKRDRGPEDAVDRIVGAMARDGITLVNGRLTGEVIA